MALSVLLLAGSCTSEFEEINTDPNNPTKVPTAYLFTEAQKGSQAYFLTTGMLYSQMWAETQYTGTSRYETAEASFYGMYSGPLADLQKIIELNTNEATLSDAAASGANVNQIAVARILKAWMFMQVTDIWGDIPYFEALQGRGSFAPAYTPQAEVYADLVKELSEASAQIDTGKRGIEGDIIYNGNMEMWRKFANSLLLRAGMRMSNADASAAQAAVNQALSAGVFDSNSDNALYQYLTDAANDNPYFQHFLTRTDYAISNVMVSELKAVNDPRLGIYGDPAPNFAEVMGMPYGVSDAVAGSITNDDISFPGIAVRGADSPGLVMTYHETLFLQAEAAARGYTSADAAMLYTDAITASMQFWGVADADITTYLAQPEVAFDAGSAVQSVMEQKWLGMYMQGIEAWNDWRRTGFPALQPAPAAAENRGIPLRRAYTNDEYSLNRENVEAAVARQGADVMETAVWWDQ